MPNGHSSVDESQSSPSAKLFSVRGHAAVEARAAKVAGHKPLPQIPPGFPHPHRLGDWELLQALLGRRIPRSTRTDWTRAGIIPKPDKMIGRRAWWKETTLASIVAVEDQAVSA
ncbi:hypothetical protein [Bradyrhizobium iriomotense]|uniref:DNA-binding protein n=1 Tax=Bradyrhizobium iriomotense TaxID=441950 RepID=A0ABQ6BD34_9BRAD|nr:hypothetical protein [Bradyrhizobium iriomotense]GLR91309.1 hypothetical protein GCM10007857_80260 [Bradyrhizobium iriomotense]